MSDQTTYIAHLKSLVNQMISERNWQQFHSPKNLSMALATEAAEIIEPFRFLTEKESVDYLNENKEEIAHELADVTILILEFCILYEIDLSKSVASKIHEISKKYPIDKAKNSNRKYTKL